MLSYFIWIMLILRKFAMLSWLHKLYTGLLYFGIKLVITIISPTFVWTNSTVFWCSAMDVVQHLEVKPSIQILNQYHGVVESVHVININNLRNVMNVLNILELFVAINGYYSVYQLETYWRINVIIFHLDHVDIAQIRNA